MANHGRTQYKPVHNVAAAAFCSFSSLQYTEYRVPSCVQLEGGWAAAGARPCLLPGPGVGAAAGCLPCWPAARTYGRRRRVQPAPRVGSRVRASVPAFRASVPGSPRYQPKPQCPTPCAQNKNKEQGQLWPRGARGRRDGGALHPQTDLSALEPKRRTTRPPNGLHVVCT
jgi:hypothetical protein